MGTLKCNDPIRRAIREYVFAKLDERTVELIEGCNTDLYQGPLSPDDALALGIDGWPGYVAALDRVRSALADSDIGDLWVTPDACVFDTEPDWSEESAEDYVFYEASHVIQIIVGSELAPYVR